jgi:hypothetical protein
MDKEFQEKVLKLRDRCTEKRLDDTGSAPRRSNARTVQDRSESFNRSEDDVQRTCSQVGFDNSRV